MELLSNFSPLIHFCYLIKCSQKMVLLTLSNCNSFFNCQLASGNEMRKTKPSLQVVINQGQQLEYGFLIKLNYLLYPVLQLYESSLYQTCPDNINLFCLILSCTCYPYHSMIFSVSNSLSQNFTTSPSQHFISATHFTHIVFLCRPTLHARTNEIRKFVL